jgi:hypothetical protein
MYSDYSLEHLLNRKTNKNLIFIHTPKCGGTYVSSILKHLNIQNKRHFQATPNEGTTFTVIRDPVARFESLLNYRLDQRMPNVDWPPHLRYVYNNKKITLNQIVSKMTDKQILGFSPFKTLKYWTKNVDIIITMENLPKMMQYFGYTYDINSFQPKNVSSKTRGKLNERNINRLKRLYRVDILLYNKVINSTLEIAESQII